MKFFSIIIKIYNNENYIIFFSDSKLQIEIFNLYTITLNRIIIDWFVYRFYEGDHNDDDGPMMKMVTIDDNQLMTSIMI